MPSIGSAPIPGPRPTPIQPPSAPRPDPQAPTQQPSHAQQQLAPTAPSTPRPAVANAQPAAIASPVPLPPLDVLAAATAPVITQSSTSLADATAQSQPSAPHLFDPPPQSSAQPNPDARAQAYSAPAWTPAAQPDGSAGTSLTQQVAVDSLSADANLDQPLKLETRLFGSPKRTAAVYVSAILLLGLSIGLLILAFGSGGSKNATATSPERSAAAIRSSEPASATAVATTPAAESLAATATVETPSTSPSAATKTASKSKTNAVPALPGTTKTPGKGTQSYIPDRP
jgi:hypothetical protein